MRRLKRDTASLSAVRLAALAALLGLASCRAPEPTVPPSLPAPPPVSAADPLRPDPDAALLEDARRLVDDPAFRRARLVAAQVNPRNGYSRGQIARYTEADWGALPVWRPRTRPVVRADLGRPYPAPDATWSALDDEQVPWRSAELRALGERAFHEYPAQLTPALRQALDGEDAPARYGLWESGERVGGLVFVELPGGVQPSLTCSSCHGSVRDGRLVSGLANSDFDLGALLDAHRHARTEAGRWGPGRVDVMTDRADNAATIPDLRPVRFQTHLNRTATLRNDPIALALRVETGIIATTGSAARPPRRLAFAIALHLWSLGEALPDPGASGGHPASGLSPGAEVYDRACGGCHGGPGLAGRPRPLDEIGTDSAVGMAETRSTGTWQVTSLRGLGQRRLFFASGSVRRLEDILSPPRGHAFAADLSPAERAELLGFLRTL